MRRELAAFFTNPAAYIVTVIFLVASGIFFFSTFFINGRADLRNFFSLLPIMLSLFVPALTMRLFSEELRSGSFETLMTLPVTSAQVILGKIFGGIFDKRGNARADSLLRRHGVRFRQSRFRPDNRRIFRRVFFVRALFRNRNFFQRAHKKSNHSIFHRARVEFRANPFRNGFDIFARAARAIFFMAFRHHALPANFSRHRRHARHNLFRFAFRDFPFAHATKNFCEKKS